MRLSPANIEILNTILPDFNDGDHDVFMPYSLIQDIFTKNNENRTEALVAASAAASIIVDEFLIERGFIKPSRLGGRYSLTELGRELKNLGYEGYFTIEDENIAKELRSKQIAETLAEKSLGKIDVETLNASWLYKTRWWPLAISFVAVVSTIIATVYAVRAYNLSQQQKDQAATKEELQQKLKETKQQIYIHLDSVLRKAHNVDSVEQK